MWAQGFSEPGAGSDLAALSTRAIRDGDSFVVNGSKIWTSYAHRADWMILLARSNPGAPRHRGISFFLVDMRSPGIRVRPITGMFGEAHFCEVFFEDVRVPAANLVGEEDRGWYVATTTLDFERSSVASSAAARRLVDRLCTILRDETPGLRGAPAGRAVRALMADLAIDAVVGRLLSYRVVTMQSAGLVPNAEASIAKVFNTELIQRVGRAGLRVFGSSGLVASGPRAIQGGFFARLYQATTTRTVGAGTSEVQRNIIALRGLGLPAS
jgi:alkylation response protein AidB-like acyl-CoA dehydrogenase